MPLGPELYAAPELLFSRWAHPALPGRRQGRHVTAQGVAGLATGTQGNCGVHRGEEAELTGPLRRTAMVALSLPGRGYCGLGIAVAGSATVGDRRRAAAQGSDDSLDG